ncbi:hypothetical protein D3C83_117130 [compost metagenome]
MADLRLVGAAAARRALAFLARETLLADAELHAGHAVLGRRERDDPVRLRLDHGDRHLLPLFVEDLGHAQLLADDSDAHVTRP